VEIELEWVLSNAIAMMCSCDGWDGVGLDNDVCVMVNLALVTKTILTCHYLNIGRHFTYNNIFSEFESSVHLQQTTMNQ